MSDSQEVISIEGLSVTYTRRRTLLQRELKVLAVDDVSLSIKRGETLGLVGESGCGKSTLGRAVLRLTEASDGRVMHNGEDLLSLPANSMRRRRRHLQMIFQDPYSSLDPRMNAGQIIAEPLRALNIGGSRPDRIASLMESVGLDKSLMNQRPRHFSGGGRQRIGIARALAVDPEFIVADEPVSALDVSIQAQILNLLRALQRKNGLTYLFISHDLRAVRYIAHRIAVMYLGRIVESGTTNEIFASPLMPYTRALLSSIPVPDPIVERRRERIVLQGDLPSVVKPPSGCRFHTRCPFAIAECSLVTPPLAEIKPNHYAACIRITPARPDISANAQDRLGAISL